jgi:hypothetical protein
MGNSRTWVVPAVLAATTFVFILLGAATLVHAQRGGRPLEPITTPHPTFPDLRGVNPSSPPLSSGGSGDPPLLEPARPWPNDRGSSIEPARPWPDGQEKK